jgi:RING finger protein 170
MRNLQLIRLLLIIIFYVLLPFDLLPERVMGIFGYIDDALIAIIIFLFFVAIVAIRYIRQYQ